jgi:hypothetical protein
MFRVDYNGTPIGLVEKFPDTHGDRNPWKSFLGIGNTTFLGVVYAKRQTAGHQAIARETAVDAVISAHEGVDVSMNEFEKAHGTDAVIPAWSTKRNAKDFSFGGTNANFSFGGAK